MDNNDKKIEFNKAVNKVKYNALREIDSLVPKDCLDIDCNECKLHIDNNVLIRDTNIDGLPAYGTCDCLALVYKYIIESSTTILTV